MATSAQAVATTSYGCPRSSEHEAASSHKMWCPNILGPAQAAARSRIAERCTRPRRATRSKLPVDSIDVAILVHMYHEIAQPYALLYNLVPALKPGRGSASIDPFRPTSEHGTPPSLLRCELAAVEYREITSIG